MPRVPKVAVFRRGTPRATPTLSVDARFVTVTNRGQVSTGRASAAGDKIELLGHDLTSEGQVAYRYTFHVTDDGVLEDRFWRPAAGGWEERHLILYYADVGETGSESAD